MSEGFYKKLKNASCEYIRLNGWNSTLQAAWYIRHVRWTCSFYVWCIIWFLKKIRYKFSAFFVTPTLPAPCGVVASARLCCLSRVPPAVCPSLLKSATTVCTSFLQSLSTSVHTPTPHSILRFRPAPQTPDLHTSNLPHLTYDMIINTQLHKKSFACSMFYPYKYEGYRAVTSLDAGRVNRSIFHNHSVHWYYRTLIEGRDYICLLYTSPSPRD